MKNDSLSSTYSTVQITLKEARKILRIITLNYSFSCRFNKAKKNWNLLINGICFCWSYQPPLYIYFLNNHVQQQNSRRKTTRFYKEISTNQIIKTSKLLQKNSLVPPTPMKHCESHNQVSLPALSNYLNNCMYFAININVLFLYINIFKSSFYFDCQSQSFMGL